MHAGRVHPAKFLLQLGNLVPKPSRHFELELTRRAQHLRVQLLDEIRKLGSGHLRDIELAVGVGAYADHARRYAAARPHIAMTNGTESRK